MIGDVLVRIESNGGRRRRKDSDGLYPGDQLEEQFGD
jgi:hypothetical protein